MRAIRVCLLFVVSAASVFPAQMNGVPEKIVSVEYAEVARRSRIEGWLSVRAKTGPSGTVEAVSFLSGYGFPFFPAVEGSVKQWRFSPCKQKARTCHIDMRFDFVLDRTCEAKACGVEVVSEEPLRYRVRASPLPAIVD
jgi:outer membrane biosynthesis protein TonB